MLKLIAAKTQVFRYSALFCGVGYGIYHQSTINSAQKHHQQVAEVKHQESLYEKAKSEWAKRTAPKSPAGDGTCGHFSVFGLGITLQELE